MQTGFINAPSGFSSRISRAIHALGNGRGVLLMDDENRENEGDLIFAAEKMTVPQMALMIRECSGDRVPVYAGQNGGKARFAAHGRKQYEPVRDGFHGFD